MQIKRGVNSPKTIKPKFCETKFLKMLKAKLITEFKYTVQCSQREKLCFKSSLKVLYNDNITLILANQVNFIFHK